MPSTESDCGFAFLSTINNTQSMATARTFQGSNRTLDNYTSLASEQSDIASQSLGSALRDLSRTPGFIQLEKNNFLQLVKTFLKMVLFQFRFYFRKKIILKSLTHKNCLEVSRKTEILFFSKPETSLDHIKLVSKMHYLIKS